MDWEEERWTLLLFVFLTVFFLTEGFRYFPASGIGRNFRLEWPVFGAFLHRWHWTAFVRTIHGEDYHRPYWYMSYLMDYGRYLISFISVALISKKVFANDIAAGIFSVMVMPVMAVYVAGHEVGTYMVLTFLAGLIVFLPILFKKRSRRSEKEKAVLRCISVVASFCSCWYF